MVRARTPAGQSGYPHLAGSQPYRGVRRAVRRTCETYALRHSARRARPRRAPGRPLARAARGRRGAPRARAPSDAPAPHHLGGARGRPGPPPQRRRGHGARTGPGPQRDAVDRVPDARRARRGGPRAADRPRRRPRLLRAGARAPAPPPRVRALWRGAPRPRRRARRPARPDRRADRLRARAARGHAVRDVPGLPRRRIGPEKFASQLQPGCVRFARDDLVHPGPAEGATMRAAPVAGESQLRVIRRCGACAHTPDDRPAIGGGAGGEIDEPASRTAPRGVREGRPMTPARTDRPLHAATLDSAIAALRAGGLRVSAARRLVLEALFAADGPATVEELADGVGGRVPRSDVASTYRNLETLEALGLVRHMHLGHGPGRYVLAAREARGWLACECCGALVAAEPDDVEPVRALVREAFGFEARFGHFPIVGLCPACAEG